MRNTDTATTMSAQWIVPNPDDHDRGLVSMVGLTGSTVFRDQID